MNKCPICNGLGLIEPEQEGYTQVGFGEIVGKWELGYSDCTTCNMTGELDKMKELKEILTEITKDIQWELNTTEVSEEVSIIHYTAITPYQTVTGEIRTHIYQKLTDVALDMVLRVLEEMYEEWTKRNGKVKRSNKE